MLCDVLFLHKDARGFLFKNTFGVGRGGGCQALLIEKAFCDDPYFQLKCALMVLDLTPLPLQSDSHLAGVNQACD